MRPSKIGPPVYAHLTDYEGMEDGQPIGRIMERREPGPGHEWFWALQITGAHKAGVVTSGYTASLEDAKAAFRVSLDRYRAWRQAQNGSGRG